MAAPFLLKHRLAHVLRSAALVGLLMSGAYAASPADEKPKDEQTKKETEPNALDKVKADEGELLQPKGAATKPTTKAAKPKMEVSAEARQLLDAVRDAYRELKTLQVAGTIVSDIDVNSEQTKNRAAFTATYSSPLTFRHETKESPSTAGGEMVASQSFGGTGKKFYAFEPRYNYVYQIEAPTERTKSSDLPPQIVGLLSQLNPSLLLAVVPDAAEELLDGVDKIEKVADIKIDGTDYPALKLTFDKQATVIFAFDPKSMLVRQAIWDRKAYAVAKKQVDVKKVEVVVDYTKTEAGVDVKPEQFAWAPPVGARDVTSLADGGAADAEGDSNALVGKPAPDFKLKDLEGKEVKLSDLKGKVIVLDFWATWCGPCRVSMPHLDQIYNDHKGDEFAAFAVNLREKNKEVKAFVDKTKLAMPVLMDTDGKVGASFGVSGIPQTVVIDKDGKVVKVTVGSGTHDQVRAAVDEALK